MAEYQLLRDKTLTIVYQQELLRRLTDLTYRS